MSQALASHKRPTVDRPASRPRQLNVLVASSSPTAQGQWPDSLEETFIRPTLNRLGGIGNAQICNFTFVRHDEEVPEELAEELKQRHAPAGWAAAVCQWADILVLLPWDADCLAQMLHGITDNNRWLSVIRSWDVTKKILLVPGMNTAMWENPMTRKQLSKLRRKWNWVRVVSPILWDALTHKPSPWEGIEELIGSVKAARDQFTIGQDINIVPPTPAFASTPTEKKSKHRLPVLPPELWSMIIDFTDDWELATALGIHTTLPVPPLWRFTLHPTEPTDLQQKLGWAILTSTLPTIKSLLRTHPTPQWLSRTNIKLIMRFSHVPLLTYLETAHKPLFREVFGGKFLPDTASSVFGSLALLDYWWTSPSFLVKEYTPTALDGASRNGYIHVLSWWHAHAPALPLKYTEAALEGATTAGRIDVLEWWKAAAAPSPSPSTNPSPAVKLKPGKSLALATQSGNLPVLRWWLTSGIAIPGEDAVAKLASTHGFVHILDYWKQLRGEKMLFDCQVLVGATKMGHAAVLEWWKRSGWRVEYKTCDIEEALEDGVEGERGDEVRRWWARNGLNLGVGTSEWMRVKVLGG